MSPSMDGQCKKNTTTLQHRAASICNVPFCHRDCGVGPLLCFCTSSASDWNQGLVAMHLTGIRDWCWDLIREGGEKSIR